MYWKNKITELFSTRKLYLNITTASTVAGVKGTLANSTHHAQRYILIAIHSQYTFPLFFINFHLFLYIVALNYSCN